MSMQMTRLLLAAALYCAGSAARAADEPLSAAAPAEGQTTMITLAPGATVLFADPEPGGQVNNAPYTAEIVRERQQILGDGNQIAHRTRTRIARDSAGRTREESFDEAGNIRVVVIRDTVSGIQWVLRPQAKSANKLAVPLLRTEPPGKAQQEDRLDAIERHARPDGSEVMLIRRLPRTAADSGTTPANVQEKVTILSDSITVRVVPAQRAGTQSGQLDPALSGAFTDMKWASQATRRALPPREIDGVKATGQLRSYAIPAGGLGNRKPIVVSDETWYAPDLRITLSSKHSDPRTGDSGFRIENLKREKPAPSLFAPPPDYFVNDNTSRIQRGRTSKVE